MRGSLELLRGEFSCRLFSRVVLEKICGTLEATSGLEEQVRAVQEIVTREIPYVRDAYSGLRYARAILEPVLPHSPDFPQLSAEHPIRHSVLCELCYLGLLRQGEEPRSLVGTCRGPLEMAALCRALLHSSAKPPLPRLLDWAGESPYLDALIRDLLREKRPLLQPKTVALELARRCRGEQPGSRRWLLYSELLAENRFPVLEPGEVEESILRSSPESDTCYAVLRIIGDCGYPSVLPSVHRLLSQSVANSPGTALACLDVMGQIGGRDSLEIVESLSGRVDSWHGRGVSGLLQQYAEVVGQGLRLRLGGSFREESEPRNGVRLEPATGPPVLVQVALNANPQSSGSAEVGGVLTFLHSLGDALGRQGALEQVITLEVLPWNVVNADTVVLSAMRGRHAILRVPVYALSSPSPDRMMIHETGIRRSVSLALRNRGIMPQLLHIRYTDNLAKAVMVMAGDWGSGLVFTLTADPHRDFTDPDGELLPMSEERALFNLNKVFIADTVLERAAGILGIAHGNVDSQLLAYFPKLCLSSEIQQKPVRVIPEGIRLDPAEPGVTESRALQHVEVRQAAAEGTAWVHSRVEGGSGSGQSVSMLFDHPGTFRLEREYSGRPVILNVGRLVDAKGQQRLVEAWAGSPINRRYNLVLIGGNLSAPNAEEAQMLAAIETTLNRYPKLEGRFCHLAALPNSLVRHLQSTLARTATEGVHVYLCSSLKEEFGISVLEAMSAGFLALAPFRGGVPTYVEHGKSGFLIDTTTADSIQKAAEQILLAEPPEELQRIAATGKRFILDNFGIEKIAGRFADFYRHIYEAR